MKNVISQVISGSIAEDAGIEKGDILISVNEKEIDDVIDYKYLIADENIVLEIEKKDGEIWDFEIKKDSYEDLGIDFEDAIMDNAKSCCNHCIFCFVDQMPKGLRKTLYFKDDDSRLSFLQGNFITLTNLNSNDIDRIIKYRISPINISVHTTDEALRVKMLHNKNAGMLYDILKKFAQAKIEMNCQIVLCPNINNGDNFIKTVEDLYTLYPYVVNVAAVPVGITRFRNNLYNITEYDEKSAICELENIKPYQEKYIKKIGSPFVRMSDEFYILSHTEIPPYSFYGDYEQLEDGIGMISFFRYNIDRDVKYINKDIKASFTFITGTAAKNEISIASKKIMKENHNIKINVIGIINNFFGETINVAGLITGEDILSQTKSVNINEYVIIPNNMLRAGEDIFLDDITIDILEENLKRKILICKYTGEDLIDVINSVSEEENQ